MAIRYTADDDTVTIHGCDEMSLRDFAAVSKAHGEHSESGRDYFFEGQPCLSLDKQKIEWSLLRVLDGLRVSGEEAIEDLKTCLQTCSKPLRRSFKPCPLPPEEKR